MSRPSRWRGGARRLSAYRICPSIFTLPTLVPVIAEAFGIAGERAAALRAALDRKDVAAVATLAR